MHCRNSLTYLLTCILHNVNYYMYVTTVLVISLTLSRLYSPKALDVWHIYYNKTSGKVDCPSSWFWMTSLPGGWTSSQAHANCFNVKTDLDECLVVKYKSTIKDEGRFQHAVIHTLVVIRLSTTVNIHSQCLSLHHVHRTWNTQNNHE